MIFCKLVEKAGYRYTAVENGKEAVETIKANLRIDAILVIKLFLFPPISSDLVIRWI